jgi:asparagine synthase (glutamine-hydrolysing)
VTRWLAGTFDPNGELGRSRLAGALAPHLCATYADGPLAVAYSGASPPAGTPLCLLDGHIDNASELSGMLGIPAWGSVEELLGIGYRRWGQTLPARLRGDFALLIWDRERGEGLLARDQLGVRSLFLHRSGGGLSFASEVCHLLALLPRQPAVDPAGVAHWIAIRGRPGTGTLYEGVHRLDPGSALLLGGEGLREVSYWSPRFAEPLELPAEELTERIRVSLAQAVRRRLDPEGVTGVLMSGGLDSSSVAAMAGAQSAPGMVAAYSAEFPDHSAVDESELIARLREDLGLAGVTAEVRAGGLLGGALDWIGAWRLPLSSWGEFWAGPLLRAACSAGVRTMLGGDGGDELFDCRAYLMADRLRAGKPLEALGLARRLPGAGERSRTDVARAVLGFSLGGALPGGLHALWARPAERRQLPGWLSARARESLCEHADPLAWKRLEGPRWWAYDAHVLTRGVEELGVFENHRRRAALAGVESRHPLFDLDLLELSLRVAPATTFDPSLDRPLLRAATSGLLPDLVRQRRGKALFDSLLIDSLTGPDGASVRRLLTGPGARLGEYVDMEKMRRALLDRGPPPGGSFRWMYRVWRLTTAECWLRACEQGGAGALATEFEPSPARVALRAVTAGPSKRGPNREGDNGSVATAVGCASGGTIGDR